MNCLIAYTVPLNNFQFRHFRRTLAPILLPRVLQQIRDYSFEQLINKEITEAIPLAVRVYAMFPG